MKESSYKSYDDLPLFLNSATVAKVLGVSLSSGYERPGRAVQAKNPGSFLCQIPSKSCIIEDVKLGVSL